MNSKVIDRPPPNEFTCPICGALNHFDGASIHRELNFCVNCGSNTRFRATILSLLLALGAEDKQLCLVHKVSRPDLRGIGISDAEVYAKILACKFSYVNTFYHAEPQLDIERLDSFRRYMPINFMICSDVIEHTLLPPAELIPILFEALQPGGILILCAPTYDIPFHLEKYPRLKDFEVYQEDGAYKIKGESTLGVMLKDSKPVFHGGPGRVLELRILSHQNLIKDLKAAGFAVDFVNDHLLKKYGSWWPEQLERDDVINSAIGKVLICKKPRRNLFAAFSFHVGQRLFQPAMRLIRASREAQDACAAVGLSSFCR